MLFRSDIFLGKASNLEVERDEVDRKVTITAKTSKYGFDTKLFDTFAKGTNRQSAVFDVLRKTGKRVLKVDIPGSLSAEWRIREAADKAINSMLSREGLHDYRLVQTEKNGVAVVKDDGVIRPKSYTLDYDAGLLSVVPKDSEKNVPVSAFFDIVSGDDEISYKVKSLLLPKVQVKDQVEVLDRWLEIKSLKHKSDQDQHITELEVGPNG